MARFSFGREFFGAGTAGTGLFSTRSCVYTLHMRIAGQIELLLFHGDVSFKVPLHLGEFGFPKKASMERKVFILSVLQTTNLKKIGHFFSRCAVRVAAPLNMFLIFVIPVKYDDVQNVCEKSHRGEKQLL